MPVILADQTLGGFLGGIASEEPAPGAGSGAAMALAIGLACARKALLFTLKHHPEETHLAALEAHLAGLVDQALAGGEADMRGFARYIAAMRAPKDAAAERQALLDLVAVGENLVAIGDEARAKLLEAKTDIYPAMINDVAAALALIAAARSIHHACVAESARSLA